MSDAPPPVIDATWQGYVRPILTAAVTRGFLWIAAFLLGHGIALPSLTEAQTANIVTGLLALAMWAWGPLKAFIDHRTKARLQAAAAPFN